MNILMIGIIAIGFTQPIDTELAPLARSLSEVTGVSQDCSIHWVYGDLTFEFVETDFFGYSCWSTLKCYGSIDPLTVENASGLLIHELGHVFLNRLDVGYPDMQLGYWECGEYIHVAGINPVTGKFERTTRGFIGETQPHIQHGLLSKDFNTYQEDFADMFMNWARDSFADDEAGRLRHEWMDAFVRAHVAKLHGESPQICTGGGVTCAR
ncbi:MAG TPA: hypothetical protein PLG04_10130 [Anaerolineaceae bacterium]|nr:hypothetical protein [Anaerolineaceae bacterium]